MFDKFGDLVTKVLFWPLETIAIADGRDDHDSPEDSEAPESIEQAIWQSVLTNYIDGLLSPENLTKIYDHGTVAFLKREGYITGNSEFTKKFLAVVSECKYEWLLDR